MKHKYDVIVVGGGPSGLMASIGAGEEKARVLLLDKGEKLGRKLSISGGGRCNVTNNGDIEDIIRHIPGNGRFLYSPFSTFNNRDIIHFFENLGVPLKEEDNGRMFPVSNQARDVVNALLKRIRMLGVSVRTRTPVKNLLFDKERVRGVRLTTGETICSKAVVVAVGGKSVPHTGSTGDGYPWAIEAGHTLTPLFPTEVPVTSQEPFIREKRLQGLSLKDVQLTVYNGKGKKIVSHTGDMIFTHFGLSGPIVLRCSQFVVKELQRNQSRKVRLDLDWLPQQSMAQLQSDTWEWIAAHPKKSLKSLLKPFLPDRAIPLLLELAGLDTESTFHHLSKEKWNRFCSLIKAFPIWVNGTLSLDKAFVTGGGVHLKEIVPQTMESKRKQGLFFAGEILDIHGYTGGYNITAALSTGYTAGKHAALSYT
ncbi:NAD(P)/FAD-dependent oxidoreductase [Kroppenstedtia pulmonis]|uniref:NAD(P)/FAD-dependent oxidoreductase n=1 Tax=Kroppenstedtia pulmonis TaxID=1380685 RepID=A0A7D3XZZ5_9BACL|nr:NAD(P)/FAD-dependent oxidoreductase [Kroppenstedtia pulmonis]QKG84020.1 NAD(P)/FAD-dependent oxidoreductase [Kroppenstedtia pulmonis]